MCLIQAVMLLLVRARPVDGYLMVGSTNTSDVQWRQHVWEYPTTGTVSAGTTWMGWLVLFPIDIGMSLSILQTSRFNYLFFISVKDSKFVAY
jgi:hypothetical protein